MEYADPHPALKRTLIDRPDHNRDTVQLRKLAPPRAVARGADGRGDYQLLRLLSVQKGFELWAINAARTLRFLRCPTSSK